MSAYPVSNNMPPPPPGHVEMGQTSDFTRNQMMRKHMIRSQNGTRVTCPQCLADVVTTVDLRKGGGAWLFCLGMFVLGFCLLFPWFFCCLPWCMDAFDSADHTCPKCSAYIGTFKPMGV